MSEDGYLEEMDRTQAVPPIPERKVTWIAALAAVLAVAIMILLSPVLLVVAFISGRRR